MQTSQVSITAMGAALMRGFHTRYDPLKLFDDEVSSRLIPDDAIDRVRISVGKLNGLSNVESLRLSEQELHFLMRKTFGSQYTSLVVRTRYTEDLIVKEVAEGASQLVVMGAGLDATALTNPFLAEKLSVVEIDHPGTQAYKKLRLARCDINLPASLAFIPIDFTLNGTKRTLEQGVDRSKRTVFSWMGVSMYLMREANMETLSAIADAGTSGDIVLFDYHHQRVFDRARSCVGFGNTAPKAEEVDEAFLSGFYPESLEEDLASVGLSLMETISISELMVRYDCHNRNQLEPTPFSLIAQARVI